MYPDGSLESDAIAYLRIQVTVLFSDDVTPGGFVGIKCIKKNEIEGNIFVLWNVLGVNRREAFRNRKRFKGVHGGKSTTETNLPIG